MIRQLFCWLGPGHDWIVVAERIISPLSVEQVRRLDVPFWTMEKLLQGATETTSKCARCGKLKFDQRLGCE